LITSKLTDDQTGVLIDKIMTASSKSMLAATAFAFSAEMPLMQLFSKAWTVPSKRAILPPANRRLQLWKQPCPNTT
jgi:hypothetical protein